MDITNITVLIATMGLKVSVIVSERTHPGYHRLPVVYQKLRAWFYPKASHVVTQSSSAFDYFKGLHNLRIIPNAVFAPVQTKQSASQDVKNIISVGRLCPFKGFDTLIQTFLNLLKHHPDLRLTIYGEGKERANLESLIESLGLKEKVLLPGTTQNINGVLIGADFFIFPSHYEGFPNALCEAMAVGLPVIASDCSGNVDVVRDGIDGRLFPVGDIHALTKIALEFLEDCEQRARLAKNAREICTRFSSEHVFALWDEAIAEAIHCGHNAFV